MFQLTLLACTCVLTIAQRFPYGFPAQQQYKSEAFQGALQQQLQPVAAGTQQFNDGSNDLQQQLKIHQLQLQEHEREIQRHLQQEQQALRGNFQPQTQQQYSPVAYPAFQTQNLEQQDYRQQQSSKPATTTNYHPPAPVHRVNIGASLQGDYDFTYDTGKGPLGQSFRSETRLPDGTVKGSYGYIDSEGRQRIVKYIAGKGGFVAEGDVGPHHVPVGTTTNHAPQPTPQQQQAATTNNSYVSQHLSTQQPLISSTYPGKRNSAIFDSSLFAYDIGIESQN
ncbi:uncharacterized protein LOC111087307 [Limulus polyphemus]|uniref:Uncharacterized protein LOC111087307 n=1 Tax=Limulus polyphemus TaxID=6850 RepID=A0ABM1T015_LIMPO|nr:uncharacterized protein LOC111087307 [Limulus polyphemus]